MEPLAEATGGLFGWLLRNSAHASVLAVLVFSLELCFWRRLSPRWRYGLWLLVLARLLLPVGPESRISVYNLVDFAPAGISGAFLQVLGLPTPATLPSNDSASALADTPNWFLLAFALWFPGALILAALIWRDHLRLQAALAATEPVDGPLVLKLLNQSKGVMAVSRDVQVVESPEVSSPAICGWWKPRLLLPLGLLRRLTPDETRFLFLHELAHVKRSDIAFNWLLAVIQVLHWFNPIVWLALRRILAVREEVCDDLVLRRSFPGASREYGLTLLRILEECAPRRIVPALAGVLDDVRTLRRRIRCIREFTRCETNPWTPALFTVGFAVAGLTERLPEPWHSGTHAPNALASSQSPTAGGAAGAARPPRTRATPTKRPTPTGFDSPAPTQTSPGSQERIILALREAAQRLKESPATTTRPAATSTAVPAAGTTPPLATFAFLPAASPVAAGANRAAAASRIYPLPPVGERGDILRPRRNGPSVATALSVTTPLARGTASFTSASGETVPAVGRSVYVPRPDGSLASSP